MKKTIFALAAFAALAMGCVKEQQPSDTPADQGKVTTIRVTVAQTKVAVDETTGACTWQEGDQLAVWYQNNEDNTTGKKVIFTYKGLLEDGSAEFTTTEAVAGYTAVKAAHPTGSIKDDGGFGLVTIWTYDAERRPVYVRSENITTNPDGSLSAQLGHNASIFKFTLHDIPAYAAGFVLETKRYNADGSFKDKIDIVTNFPYKTGYTADPADNSNDIDLYSVAPHSSYLSRIYLIDGDGSEIEGSEKKFKQSGNDVSNHDFIELPRVDFQKANLRKDYVKVIGLKWAKGNLVRDYRSMKSHEIQEGVDDGFQTGWGLHDEQWKYINWENSEDYEYSNSYPDAYCDVFNWGGIGRFSAYHAGCLIADNQDFSIQAKVYSGYQNQNPNDVALSYSFLNPENLTELEGEARFSAEMNEKNNTVYNGQQLAGDVAFWASKGKYCLPSSANLTALSNAKSSVASFQYGKYEVEGKTIYGFLYTTPYPKGNIVRSIEEVTFTDADIESGLFLPLVGRRGNTSNNKVINRGTLAFYRCANFGDPTNASHAEWHSKCARGIFLKKETLPLYGFTAKKDGDNTSPTSDDGYSGICHLSAAAGGAIRPILVETAE